MSTAGRCTPAARLRFVAESEADPGRLLVDDMTGGWYEIFDDPLLDAAVLRIWLDVLRLDVFERATISPAGVVLTPRAPRTKRGCPAAFSAAETWRDTAGCE